MKNRDNELNIVYDLIEKDLKLIGATAILDELQDKVPSTMKTLLSANIRIWMLTGDKTETAINIGYTTNLLKDSTDVKVLDYQSVNECVHFLSEIMKEKKINVIKKSNGKRVTPTKTLNMALIIPGSVSFEFKSD